VTVGIDLQKVYVRYAERFAVPTETVFVGVHCGDVHVHVIARVIDHARIHHLTVRTAPLGPRRFEFRVEQVQVHARLDLVRETATRRTDIENLSIRWCVFHDGAQ